MNSTINSWTSGIVNFLNMGRGHRESVADPGLRNQGGDAHYWPSQGGYNQGGYNPSGYNQSGYTQGGYNQGGYGQNGYGQNGFVQSGSTQDVNGQSQGIHSQTGPVPHYPNMHGFVPGNPSQKTGGQFISPVEYSHFTPNIPNFKTAAFTSISGLRQIVSITDIGSVVAHYYDLSLIHI